MENEGKLKVRVILRVFRKKNGNKSLIFLDSFHGLIIILFINGEFKLE